MASTLVVHVTDKLQANLPPVAPIPTRPFTNMPFSYPAPSLGLADNIYQSVGLTGLTLQDPRLPLDMATPLSRTPSSQVRINLRWMLTTQSGTTAVYRPSQMTVELIMSGKLDYMRMDPRSEYDLIRPLVWTIAHQEPKSNSQA
jgi:hypothetical protein